MSEAEKTITIVLGQKGENITTKQIFIMDKENIITHTPTDGGIIMVERDGAYKKTGNIPTEFTISKNPTADIIHKAADAMEKVDGDLNGPTEDEKMGQAVDALTQQKTNPALIDAQLAQKQGTSDPYGTRMVSEPGTEPIGPELLGGYRITKRRRNPRRKQKKSYRRRRRV
jgi:hypothetical protein